MPVTDVHLLREIALFQLMDDDELNVLAGQLDQKRYWKGQSIFAAGDPGGMMYVVQSGRVEIFLKDKSGEQVRLDIVETGDLFGELSLLDNQPRSASARAVEDTTVFVIDRHDLSVLVKSHPDAALDMMAMLGRRIRDADILVGERVASRNVNEEVGAPTSFGGRLSDVLTRVAGDIRFVYFNFLWFTIWIVLNVNILPGVEAFDPFPFGLLTMIVSLLAIFLSLFVLISQNRQAERERVRNDIEYEVNIRAELEIRDLHDKIDTLQDLLLGHLQRMDTTLENSVKQQTRTRTRRTIPGEKGEES